MELRHLRVFLAVADELHFGRAAQKLHLTQPSISGYIRALETELDVRLLTRTARHVALTDAGRVFLDDARRIVRQSDEAITNLRSWQIGDNSRLRIGYVADALPSSVPLALRRLATTANVPGLQMSSDEPHELIAQVRDESLHAAIVSLPAPVKGLRSTAFEHEEAAVAVSTHAFDGCEEEIPLGLVAGGAVFARPRRTNPGFFDTVLAAFRNARLPSPLLEIERVSVEELLLRVAAGAGMALMPASVGQRTRVPGVTFRKLVDTAPVACELAIVTLDRQPPAHLERVLEALTRPQPPAPARPLLAVA